MGSLFYLFWLFAKIGFFTFGGGYAMIPLFQDELVTRHQYMTEQDFAGLVALAQMTPGPVGLNAATYIGYQQGGIAGSVFATAGVMMPSLVIVMLAAAFLVKFKENRWLKSALGGIRPVVVGLIAAAVIFFADTSVFSAPLNSLWNNTGARFGVCWQGAVIFLVTLAVSWKWKLNLIYTLLGAAVLSLILMRF